MTALTLAAPFTGALLGLYELDLQHFSGFRAYLASVGQPAPEGSIAPLVLVALLSLPLQTLMFAPLAFGEEWGWRGYLLPQLAPLGQWRALLISGVIWGLWHAPLILLGGNYPGRPLLGILLWVVVCTIIGILLSWTRLASGSVWPAVLGHAALDASIPVSYIWSRAGTTYDPTEVTIIGWTGWILPLLFIALLALTRRLPVRNAPDLVSPAATEAVVAREPAAV